jgi:hypothetical protein
MMVISREVAINGRASGRSWSLRADPNTAGCLRFAIGLPFAQHPIRRFGQMPGHRPDGFRVVLAPRHPLVEATDVAARGAPARKPDRVRRFDERPFEVAVDVRPGRPKAGLPAAGVDARRRASIPGQLLGMANRVTSPTSRAITTASVSPTPGRVSSRCIAGVGLKTAWIRCSNPRTPRSSPSICASNCSVAYAVCGSRRLSRGRSRARSRTPKRSLTSTSWRAYFAKVA